jgi:hypothetical protein
MEKESFRKCEVMHFFAEEKQFEGNITSNIQ